MRDDRWNRVLAVAICCVPGGYVPIAIGVLGPLDARMAPTNPIAQVLELLILAAPFAALIAPITTAVAAVVTLYYLVFRRVSVVQWFACLALCLYSVFGIVIALAWTGAFINKPVPAIFRALGVH